MALIDISAEIKGSSEATAVPIRIITATAVLTGTGASGLRRPPPPAEVEPVKSSEPETGA